MCRRRHIIRIIACGVIAALTIGCTGLSMMSFKENSKHLYDKLILAPMDAYNEAMRLYLAGKFWQASFAFGKVISLFPNFHLNDKAFWYLGDCYTKLNLNQIARDVFSQSLEEFTSSEMRPKYLFGLERLDYREGNYDEALKEHAFIINFYPESEIRFDADYLAGEIQFMRKNFIAAEKLLSNLKPGHPKYLFALYTLAIINIELNNSQAAIQNLSNSINDSSEEPSDQLLREAAALKLGHLYFESGDQLRRAVEMYARVPEGSPFQEEALLATGWAWIKVNRPQQVIQALDQFFLNCSESSLTPEAYLLKGYALMLLKRFDEAIEAFKLCQTSCTRHYISDDDLRQHKAQFDEYAKLFATTAERIKKNALMKPTENTLEERPDLEKAFLQFANENDAFFNYAQTAASDKRFFKRKGQILMDVEYALKLAEKIKNRR
jgi:TolA-binding protein